MSQLLHPNYSINIGSKKIEPSSNDLIRLTIDLHLDTPADSCRASLRPGKWTADLKRDDSVTVALGYESDSEPVFAGSLDSIERTLSNVRTFSLSGALKLLDLRVNEIYADQNAGDIVKDLAKKAGLDVDEIQVGIDLPKYYVGTSRNAYDHIRELAERCAYDVFVTPDNKLAFKEYKPKVTHLFEYAKHIISIEAVFREPTYGSVKAYGESPSSKKGSDTSHWLTKDDVTNEVGSGNQLEIIDSSIRDTDTAEKVAKAKLKALSFSKFFKLTVVGSPKVKLGDAVKVKSMPAESLNGEFKVMRVEHILSKDEGFITHIECAGLKEK